MARRGKGRRCGAPLSFAPTVQLVAGVAGPPAGAGPSAGIGAALAADMAVAVITAHVGNGFFVEDGGGELVLLLGGTSIAVALAGAGRFSTDAAFGLPTGIAQATFLARSRLVREPKSD